MSDINIGPVQKKDVQKASKWLVQTEEENIKKEYAVILAFDVPVNPDANQFANDNGVTIMTANIIYHLCDQF